MSHSPTPAPFGSWASPVTTDLIVADSIRLGQLALYGNAIYWTEGRPQEGGRNVLVRAAVHTEPVDLTPAPFNVRSRVHEYGGGAFCVDARGIWFSHFDDQQLYRVDAGSEPVPLTRRAGMRYADAIVDAGRGRLIAVGEDHAGGGPEPVNTLIGIDLVSGELHTLATGHDFYSSPCLSPDGRHLAWLTWDHPDMPWDGTELWLAELAPDGSLSPPRKVAGGRDESIFQPAWSRHGELHFVADRSGWWNLYRLRAGAIEALLPMAAEFGEPQWEFGVSTYGFDQDDHIVCLYERDGDTHLGRLDPERLAFELIETPFRVMHDLQVEGSQAVFIGTAATAPAAVVALDLNTREYRLIRSASSAPVDADFVSTGQAIVYPTENGLQAHAFYYAPTNRDFTGPAGECPPLIVMTHGGPTSACDGGFNWAKQYWTSRGFAVVDVNYGGSSGYGRAYRQRLNGQWGVVDVDDAVNAVKYLADRGEINPERVAIRGGSAGGYTTLCALTFRTCFKAGASHYGIGDLEALVRDTHKFESRYTFGLVGPYPEAQALYRARSPIHFSERLSSAMILFQGSEDKVVPPNQAESMYRAVRDKGLPVAYLLFEHEQHGFRRAENIARALEAELYFYARVFGFEPHDRIAPVTIDNLAG